MIDRELIKAELQNLQKILEAKADMCIGNGKVKLLSFANACNGALGLLKEQEPRVLTLEELRQLEGTDHFVWVENNGDGDCFDGFGEITISILSNSVEIFQFGNEVEWKPCNDDYGKTWRCWTTRPTDEQREAVKWE